MTSSSENQPVSLTDLEQAGPFAGRHIGTTADDQQAMLEAIGYSSLDDLLGDAIPAGIREKLALALPAERADAAADEIAEGLNDELSRRRQQRSATA